MLLYIGNKNYSSWSLRPWVLLKELQIPFEERLVPFRSRPFREFTPSSRVPCLYDGDRVVWDSLAIVEYVAESHPAAWPADRGARAWARSAAAEMHSSFGALRTRCSMSCGVRIRVPITPELQADLDRIDEIWAEGLARFGGPFLAGDTFTAVDAFFAPVAFRAQTYDLPLKQRAYGERLLALPSMREWYEAALAEPFRDEPHEVELRAAGEWLADHRVAST
jgi:glutathione S-transferase